MRNETESLSDMLSICVLLESMLSVSDSLSLSKLELLQITVFQYKKKKKPKEKERKQKGRWKKRKGIAVIVFVRREIVTFSITTTIIMIKSIKENIEV